jgi:hypothetical protein
VFSDQALETTGKNRQGFPIQLASGSSSDIKGVAFGNQGINQQDIGYFLIDANQQLTDPFAISGQEMLAILILKGSNLDLQGFCIIKNFLHFGFDKFSVRLFFRTGKFKNQFPFTGIDFNTIGDQMIVRYYFLISFLTSGYNTQRSRLTFFLFLPLVPR